MSLNLLHKLVLLIVAIVLATVMISILFEDDTRWQEAVFLGIKNKINVAVNNAHWQWQKNGRPSSILIYQQADIKPFVAPFEVKMNSKGWPEIGDSDADCMAFLASFTRPFAPEMSAAITAKFELSDTSNVPLCVFEHKAFGQFSYNLVTGNVRMTKTLTL